MAEKILNTRIITKHAEWETWQSSTLELKEGEVVLAKVTTTETDATGRIKEVPAFIAKVGNGTTFANTPWLYAKAVDVYGWAKKANLDVTDFPVLNLTDAALANVKSAIDAKVESTEYASFVQTITQTISNNKTAIEEALADEVEAREALDERVVATETAIQTINGEGDGSIKKAAADTLASAKSYTDGQIAEVTGAAGELGGRVTDLENAVDAINDGTTGILATAKGYTDTEVAKANAAAKAADDKAAAAQGEVDALEGVVATLTQTVSDNKTAIEQSLASEVTNRGNEITRVESLINTEKTNRENADTALGERIDGAVNRVAANETAIKNLQDADVALDGRVDTLEAKVANVTNVMDFRGAVTELPDSTEGYQDGDVIVVTDGDNKGKEYVVSDGAFVEFGYTDANASAISALQTRMTAVEGVAASNTQAIADEASARSSADQTLQGNINTLSGTVTANKNAYDAYVLANDARVKAVEDDIAALNDTYATDAELAGEVATLNEAISKKLDATTFDGYKTSNDARVKAIEDDYLVEADKTELDNKISTNATDIDTLEGKVAALEAIDNATQAELDAYKEVVTDAIADALQAAKDYADENDANTVYDDTALANRVSTNENDIANLKAASAKHISVGIDNKMYLGEEVIIFDCGGAE